MPRGAPHMSAARAQVLQARGVPRVRFIHKARNDAEKTRLPSRDAADRVGDGYGLAAWWSMERAAHAACGALHSVRWVIARQVGERPAATARAGTRRADQWALGGAGGTELEC